MSRTIGFLIGIIYTDGLFHTRHVQALELVATTAGERMGALLIGAIVTILFYIICMKFFSSSFFNGVIAASGFFASFDIVAFHWIFKLHRLTHGPEADVIEPILVIFGIVLLVYGVKREREITS